MKKIILIATIILGGIFLNHNIVNADNKISSQPQTDWIYYKDINIYSRTEHENTNGKRWAEIFEKRASVYEKYVGQFRYLQVRYYVGRQYVVDEAYQNRRYNQTNDFYGRYQYATSYGWYFNL